MDRAATGTDTCVGAAVEAALPLDSDYEFTFRAEDYVEPEFRSDKIEFVSSVPTPNFQWLPPIGQKGLQITDFTHFSTESDSKTPI